MDLGIAADCRLLNRATVTSSRQWHLPSRSVEFRRVKDTDADAGSHTDTDTASVLCSSTSAIPHTDLRSCVPSNR